MTCASVLEALLVAEPSEVAAEGKSMLAEHLRSCDRCRRLAGQLLIDTRLLATALQASSMRRRRSNRARYASLAPAGLVATLLVLAVLRTPTVVDAPPITDVAVARTPPEPAIRSTEPPPASSAPIERAVPTSRVRLRSVRAFPPPVPVAEVRIDPSERSISMTSGAVSPAVSVDPPAGIRVAILHTSNPKLVVVWLY